MTLNDIVKQFIEMSGRYDLLDEKDSTGLPKAVFFIRAGQRYLDSKGVFPLTSYYAHFSEKDYYTTIPYPYRMVSAYTIDREIKRPLKQLTIERFLKLNFANLARTEPISFCLLNLAVQNPEELFKSSCTAQNIPNLLNPDYSIHLVLIPLANRPLDVQLNGYFYDLTLNTLESTNRWTLRHPEVLLHASLYTLETFQRNTEGATDWLNALQEDIRSILLSDVPMDTEEVWIHA